MTRALVLSGGGARGSFQAGVVEGLVADRGIDFDILFGVSTGALNAAFLAQASTGVDPVGNLAQRSHELRALWRSFTGNSSIYTGRFGYVGLVAGANSLYDNAPLKRVIANNIDAAALRGSGRVYGCGFVSLVSGRYDLRTNTEDGPDADDRLLEGIIASASIPVAFPFVAQRDAAGALVDVLVDGGVRDLSPLGAVFREDPPPDEIYVVLASKLEPESGGFPGSADRFPRNGATPDKVDTWKDNFFGTKVNGTHVLARTLELLTDEIYLSDVREALLWNSAVKGIKAVTEAADAGDIVLTGEVRNTLNGILDRRRHADIYVIAPHRWWDRRSEAEQDGEPENDSMNFDSQLIEEFLDHGRVIANDESKWLVRPESI